MCWWGQGLSLGYCPVKLPQSPATGWRSPIAEYFLHRVCRTKDDHHIRICKGFPLSTHTDKHTNSFQVKCLIRFHLSLISVVPIRWEYAILPGWDINSKPQWELVLTYTAELTGESPVKFPGFDRITLGLRIIQADYSTTILYYNVSYTG